MTSPLKKTGRPVGRDALEDLASGDFLEDLEGWTAHDMVKTIGRMIKGADNIAKCLANGAETMSNRFSDDCPADPTDIDKLSKSLQATAKAIESYSMIYSWALGAGRTGNQARHNALDDLMPFLDMDEMSILRGWMTRLEAIGA